MGLDLKVTNIAQKSEEGYRFELMLPSLNEGTGAFLTIRGTNSAKVKAHSKGVFNRMQMKESLAKRKGREPDQLSLDEAEEMSIEGAYVRLISWEGIEENDVPVEFTESEVKRILREHDWIRSAILDEADQIANFI